MHDHEETGNAFAIPDLWEKSALADVGRYVNHAFTENEGALCAPSSLDGGNERSIPTLAFPVYPAVGEYLPTSFPFPPSKDLDFHIPDLISFEYGPLENLGNPELSLASSVNGSTGSFSCQDQEEEDVWSATQIFAPGPEPAEFKSWDRFYAKAVKEPRTAYISEAGSSAFDAALTSKFTGSNSMLSPELAGCVLPSGPLLTSLLHLGLGRESWFYHWVEQEGSFRPCVANGRMSGYTNETFHSLEQMFIGYGTQMRDLHSFINKSYANSESLPSLIAVADGFFQILSALQVQLNQSSTKVCSLLQVQYLFHRPGLILSCLSDMSARLGSAKSDKELLSELYSFVQELEHSTTWLRPLAFQILAHASRPWLVSVGCWIGLQADVLSSSQGSHTNLLTPSGRFQNDGDGKDAQELKLDFVSSLMPSFVTNQDMHSIFGTNLGLQLLRTHKPEHPLVGPKPVSSVEPPPFEWHFSWQDVERVEARVKDYEARLVEAVREFNISESQDQVPRPKSEIFEQNPTGPSGVSLETTQADLDVLMKNLEEPLPQLGSGGDALSKTVMHCTSLFDESVEGQAALFAPPLSLVPQLSFSPVLSAQAHLINKACLRLLFKEHKLRMHLSLQNRYHFFGDGVFASRLSHALFDPELQTAERHKGRSRSGVAGVSGLKLGYRDSWPPASSELRLALMGILSESYHNNRQAEGSSSHRAELPGGLSFAIREMPENELQRCLDPHSIEALDFLRLQYRPPPPLDVVITISSLTKYDSIFKVLLRAVRMIFVVGQLYRGSIGHPLHDHSTIIRRFRIEAHHFVSATCEYFFDGVTKNWAIFERMLRRIERNLDHYDAGDDEGIQFLRNYHEKILDRIMFALIIRKRQEQVMKLLEDIFSSILRFASTLQSSATIATERRQMDGKVLEIYERFRKNVRVFISVCRGLSERRGQGGTSRHNSDDDLFVNENADEDGGNTIGQLLLKLEMSGYYSRPAIL